jgi:hypothetical protein
VPPPDVRLIFLLRSKTLPAKAKARCGKEAAGGMMLPAVADDDSFVCLMNIHGATRMNPIRIHCGI